MANIITCIRIALSAALLFCPALSPAFYGLYIAVGYIKRKAFAAVHSVMNKVTGGLLFLFPLTLAFIDLRYSGAAVCAAATVAAVYEGCLIQAGKTA